MGGSDAAAVLGVSKYRTPLDVYLDKTTENIPEVQNAAMARGSALEPFVKALFEYTTGKIVEDCPGTVESLNYPFIRANLDGFYLPSNAVVEFKTASFRTKDEWGNPLTQGLPVDYYYQLVHYCYVMGSEIAYLGVLFGDEALFKSFIYLNELKQMDIDFSKLNPCFNIYTFTRDKEAEERLITAEVDFWENHVLKKIPPPLTLGEDIRKLHPVGSRKSASATPEIIDLLNEYYTSKDLLRRGAIKDIIKLYLNDADILVDSEGLRTIPGTVLATWKNNSITTVDIKRLEAEHPLLVPLYKRTTVTRKFLIL